MRALPIADCRLRIDWGLPIGHGQLESTIGHQQFPINRQSSIENMAMQNRL
jgi:hypothetical protein